VYKEGGLVWFLKPPDLSAKLQSKWIGPCNVMKRVGKGSYTILTKPNVEHHAHDDQLKIHHEDISSGNSKPLNHFRGSLKDIDWQKDEYEAEKILDHRKRRDGNWEFKVKWKGCDINGASWEPLNHFSIGTVVRWLNIEKERPHERTRRFGSLNCRTPRRALQGGQDVDSA
jgi:hypothetical protein